MRVYWAVLLISILLLSCKNGDDSSTPNPYAARMVARLNPTDSFLYEVPKSKHPKLDSMFLEEGRLNRKYIGLESIEKGYDSIQIRVWYGCINTPYFLVVLRNSNNKWGAEICRIVFPRHYERNDSISRLIIRESPKSGWTKFIDELFDLKILTLPNDAAIPNFQGAHVMDGCAIEVEVATRNAYRQYTYVNPRIRYWQANNMMNIVKLINDEFEIQKRFKPKHLWPNEARNDQYN